MNPRTRRLFPYVKLIWALIDKSADRIIPRSRTWVTELKAVSITKYWWFIRDLERVNGIQTHLEIFRAMPFNVHQLEKRSKSRCSYVVSLGELIGIYNFISSTNSKNLHDLKQLFRSFINKIKSKGDKYF